MGAVSVLRAVGYVRVSTDDQAREGVSLDAQEARIRAYCEARGWVFTTVVRDEGKSAKDLNRPGLQRLLGALPRRHRDFDALVVVKLDRLTRSVKDLGTLMEAFKRARIGFTSIQESVDTSSASGELFFNLVASVSQWERRAIGERTKAALAHLRAAGRQVSRWAPYGFRAAPGRHLAVVPQEQGRPAADPRPGGLRLVPAGDLAAPRGAGRPGPEWPAVCSPDALSSCHHRSRW